LRQNSPVDEILANQEGQMAEKTPNEDKKQALARRRCLNPRPERVKDELFASSEFFDPLDLLQVKYEMLRRAQLEGQPVGAAAAAFGFSRPAFYEALRRFDEEGLVGLLPRKRGPRQGHKVTDSVYDFIADVMAEDPDVGTDGLLDRVRARFALDVHRRTMERAVSRVKKER
jgi:transposase